MESDSCFYWQENTLISTLNALEMGKGESNLLLISPNYPQQTRLKEN